MKRPHLISMTVTETALQKRLESQGAGVSSGPVSFIPGGSPDEGRRIEEILSGRG